MLRLVSQMNPSAEQRLTRMLCDALMLSRMSAAELNEAREVIEQLRDALTRLLDRAEDEDV